MADNPKSGDEPPPEPAFPPFRVGLSPETLARIARGLELPSLDFARYALPDQKAGTPEPIADEPGQVAGGGKPKTRTRKPKGASTLPILGGKREVKAYPVTEDELENLGVLSLAVTASFSVASFLAAFWLSVRTSIALSAGVKPEIISYWDGLATGAGAVSLALFGLGVYLIYRRHTKVSKIKSGTAHE